MSIWTALKNRLKKAGLADKSYVDSRITELEKENKKQQKIIKELQKNAGEIEKLKDYINKELERRDHWGIRADELVRQADGKQMWVIKCPAPEEKKVRWGDYAYAVSLKRYLDRLGVYTVIDLVEDWNCEEAADVVLVLRGVREYRPDRRNKKCLYIMWNISHPDDVTVEEYERYDVVCVGSLYYAEKLKAQLNVPVFPLLQCTDTEMFYPDQKTENSRNGYIFIGNTRGVPRRPVMWAAQENLPLRIWGSGWKAPLGEKKTMVQELFIENAEIPELYRTSKVTLNDHWQDMLDYQFVNNRIFDALACGLPVISDFCDELKEIFPDAVLYYSTKEEFDACVREIETNYPAVKEKVDAQWPLIQEKYSFEARAKELIEIAGKYKGEIH